MFRQKTGECLAIIADATTVPPTVESYHILKPFNFDRTYRMKFEGWDNGVRLFLNELLEQKYIEKIEQTHVRFLDQ